MSLALNVLSNKPVLGSFDKGLAGARSLNFGLSAGKHCETSCRYHPENKESDATGRCYAIRNERRFDRVQLLNKLERHEGTNPAVLARKALAELMVIYAGGNKVPWFRFSTNGSVPQPRDVKADFKAALIDLLDFCDAKNIPVHFPVESIGKYKFYQKLVGSRCTVRLSAQNEKQYLNTTVPVSYVGGSVIDPNNPKKSMTRIDRVKASKEIAAKRADHMGRKVIVCPAVAANYLYKLTHATSKAKCGNCTACAEPDKDVIYPIH